MELDKVYCVYEKLDYYYKDNDRTLVCIKKTESAAKKYIDELYADHEFYFYEEMKIYD